MTTKKPSHHKTKGKSSGSGHGEEPSAPEWHEESAPAEAPTATPIPATGEAPPGEAPPTFAPAGEETMREETPSFATEMGAKEPPAAPTTPTLRGLPLVAALGWVLLILGLLLPSYMYSWSLESGIDYRLAGIPGTILSALLVIAGLAVGIVFSYFPTQPRKWDASPSQEWIRERADKLHVASMRLRILSFLGIVLAAMGLLLAAYVSFQRLQAGSADANVDVLGSRVVASEWINVGYALGAVGFFLWLATYFQMSATIEALGAARIASGAPQPAAPTPPAGAGAAGETLPAGVTPAHLEALMRRVDGLLATLPDDVVTEFSKSPEADTYLKLLGGKGPQS